MVSPEQYRQHIKKRKKERRKEFRRHHRRTTAFQSAVYTIGIGTAFLLNNPGIFTQGPDHGGNVPGITVPTTEPPTVHPPATESPRPPVTPSERVSPRTESPVTVYENSSERNSKITKAAKTLARRILEKYHPPHAGTFDAYCPPGQRYLSQGAPIPAKGTCFVQHNPGYDGNAPFMSVDVQTDDRRRLTDRVQGVHIDGGVQLKNGSPCYVQATLSDGTWEVYFGNTPDALTKAIIHPKPPATVALAKKNDTAAQACMTAATKAIPANG
jgi:hypothetical protein